MGRINHLACIIAAILFYFLGALWYDLFFKSIWVAEMAKTGVTPPGPSATIYILAFVTGLILSYGTAFALTRRIGDQTMLRGMEFSAFMGIVLWGSMSFSTALFEGKPLMLWLIDFGYVYVGFIMIGAIVGAWKVKKPVVAPPS